MANEKMTFDSLQEANEYVDKLFRFEGLNATKKRIGVNKWEVTVTGEREDWAEADPQAEEKQYKEDRRLSVDYEKEFDEEHAPEPEPEPEERSSSRAARSAPVRTVARRRPDINKGANKTMSVISNIVALSSMGSKGRKNKVPQVVPILKKKDVQLGRKLTLKPGKKPNGGFRIW